MFFSALTTGRERILPKKNFEGCKWERKIYKYALEKVDHSKEMKGFLICLRSHPSTIRLSIF